jgi:hypothetical protein
VKPVLSAWILEEGDAPAVHAAAVDEAGSAQEGSRSGVVLDDVADQPRQVLRGAPPAGVGQAVRVGEMRGAQAQLGRLGVHALDEGILGAAEVLGHRRRGVVGRSDGHAFEEGAERHLFARAEPHAVARGFGRAPADRHGLVPLRAPRLEVLAGEVERHELHQARRRVVLGWVLGEEDCAVGG